MNPFTAIILIVLIFVLTQVCIEIIRIVRITKLRKLVAIKGKPANQRRISVVVTAGRKKSDVIELIDQLASQSYTKLQIIVVPRNRGKRKESEYIRTYKAAHPDVDLRVVSKPGKIALGNLLRYHVRGELVVWADSSQTLPPRFFESVSYEFTDTSVNQLNIPVVPHLDSRLTTAIGSWMSIRSQVASLFGLITPRMVLPIYRVAYLKKADGRSIEPKQPRLAIEVSTKTTTSRRYAATISTINIWIIGLVIAATVMYIPGTWMLVAAVAAVAYLLAHLLWLSASRSYTLSQKLLLVLVLPFASFGLNPLRSK